MKRYMGMRSPEISIDLHAEGLGPRGGGRRRQLPGQAWESPSSPGSSGIHSRTFPDQAASTSGQYPLSVHDASSAEPHASSGARNGESQRCAAIARPGEPTVHVESSPWTEEEDAVLREGVLRFGTQAWDQVARHLLPPVAGGPQMRSTTDCSARWDAVVRHTAVKGPWLPEEDALLRQLVAKFGPKRWALIAGHIPGRAGKQCREVGFGVEHEGEH